MKYKNHFKLYLYEDALIHSVIINNSQLDYYIWLELPHNMSKYLSLYEITEIKSGTELEALEFDDKIMRECNRPWIRAEWSLFNMEVGYHIYKLLFYDNKIDEIVSLYFAYRIQTDNPNKSSYIYMKREERFNG